MNLGTLLHDWGEKIPGHSWLSGSVLGDVVTGGLARGAERNNWRAPFGHQTSSFDDIFGAGASRTEGGRNLARGVGAAFGGGALYGALGGSSAAAGEGAGGASEVGYGFPLAEEAGGAGAGGQLSGPAPSVGWQDYLRRYGRQGMNLLSNMPSGSPGAGAAAGALALAPQDNSMIEPLKAVDPFAEHDSQSISPEILAMLLNPRWADQASEQSSGPYISSGGLA